LSENAGDTRFKRLQRAFQNPLTEVSLFFCNASIPLFTNFNKLLQSIHIVYDSVIKLANTLGNRVIKVEVMKKKLNEINLQDPTIYLPLAAIHLGGTTKFTLQRLLSLLLCYFTGNKPTIVLEKKGIDFLFFCGFYRKPKASGVNLWSRKQSY